MEVINKIVNSEIVVNHFGYWPNFHDATINRLSLATLPTGRYSITLQLTAFEYTSKLTSQVQYELANHCLIEIEFTGIQEAEYEEFSYQNVAFEILFSEVKGCLQCLISPSVGLYARILAEEVLIVSLQKIQKENKVITA